MDAIYARYSSTDEGDSIPAQIDLARDWLTRNGADPDAARVYKEDNQSAYNKRLALRPEWSRLAADMRAGLVDRVVTRHIDRITRSVRDMLDLIDLLKATQVQVRTVWAGDVDVSTETGKAVATIIATLAEAESATKAERVRAAKARARAQGRKSGGARRFGYDKDDVSLVQEEADMIRRGMADVLEGVSLHSLAREWNDGAVKPLKADVWSSRSVKSILVRWRNAGRIEHQGVDVGQALFPEIVSMETLQAVRALLLDPSRRANQVNGGPSPKTLLTGIAECGKCGSTMKGRTQSVGQGQRVDSYVCSAPDCHIGIRRDLLDSMASEAMVRFYMTTDPAEYAPSEDKEEFLRLRAEQGEVAAQGITVSELWGKGVMTGAEAEAVLRGLRDREEHLQAEIESMQRRNAMAASLSMPVVYADGRVDITQAAAVKGHFEGLHRDVRRLIIGQVWRIIVHPRWYAKPAKVYYDGEVHVEKMTPEDRQRRRVRLESKLNGMIVDPHAEAVAEFTLTATSANI